MTADLRDGTLAGLSVIVTRPRLQAAGLAAAIEACGGQVIRFPVVEIAPPTDPGTLHRIRHCDQYDWLIFISANAAEYGLAALGGDGKLPHGPRVAAIGPATARTLASAGIAVDLTPTAQAHSESLLAATEFQELAGKRILIVRGEGGREALRAGLERAGASVDYAEVYRRDLPAADTVALAQRVEQARSLATVVTSVTGLHNLLSLVGPGLQAVLSPTALLVIGNRQARAARESSWRGPILVADSAADERVIAVLKQWHGKKQ